MARPRGDRGKGHARPTDERVLPLTRGDVDAAAAGAAAQQEFDFTPPTLGLPEVADAIAHTPPPSDAAGQAVANDILARHAQREVIESLRAEAHRVFLETRDAVSTNAVRAQLAATGHDGDARVLGAVFRTKEWVAVGFVESTTPNATSGRAGVARSTIRSYVPRAHLDAYLATHPVARPGA